ncbi:FIG039767: hypothetical protein [hydrothermal vent metagenome]|uniref:DUF4194 domain-containing protein n=1 Tax=hydrothermal vent metagenome TaxID=652676 RepID=A0A3B0VZG4_9ZZZZ
MSKNEKEEMNPASGATDLLERLRQVQSNQEQANQAQENQDLSSNFEANIEANIEEYPTDNLSEPTLLKPTLDSENSSKNDSKNNAENNSNFERGKMPPEARRVLVNLLKHGVILSAQKNTLFESACRYQSAIRNHLADVYLKLILDEKSGIAFVAQMDESEHNDLDAVSLMTRRTLSLYDTLVLLVLRKHYQERESAGEQRIVIDIERIEANLTPFLPLTNSMKSDQRKLSSSLTKMVEKHLLSKVRGSDDRFEITPIIRYIVNADFLEQMLEAYQALAHKSDVDVDPGSHSESS